MIKFWLVAQQEYRRHVLTKRFLFGLLSVPLIMVLMVGLVFLIIAMYNNTTPIGYVDHSGLLANPLPAPVPEPPDKPVPMIAYSSEREAAAALEAGTIQAYYVLPADYLTTGVLRRVHYVDVKPPARQQFAAFLAANLLAESDPAVARRLTDGPEVIVQSADGRRSIGSDNWFNFILPMVAGIGFVIAIFSAGGYLMQAVVEEKENRTMEVIVTSVSPNQFMSGKIVADIAIGLTQILVWVLFIVVPILLARDSLPLLQGLQISSQTVIVLIFTMLPSFVLVTALMAAIGASVTEAREGQQLTSMISFPIWIPYMLTGVLMQSPNSPVAVALSLLPLTAPISMLMRDGMTILPVWQIAACALIQISGAAAAIWLAGRAFRLGMLRYGKRLAWRELFARQGGKA